MLILRTQIISLEMNSLDWRNNVPRFLSEEIEDGIEPRSNLVPRPFITTLDCPLVAHLKTGVQPRAVLSCGNMRARICNLKFSGGNLSKH